MFSAKANYIKGVRRRTPTVRILKAFRPSRVCVSFDDLTCPNVFGFKREPNLINLYFPPAKRHRICRRENFRSFITMGLNVSTEAQSQLYKALFPEIVFAFAKIIGQNGTKFI